MSLLFCNIKSKLLLSVKKRNTQTENLKYVGGYIFMKYSLSALSLLPILLSSSATFASDAIATDIYSEDTISEEIDYKDWHFYKIEVDNPAKLTVKLRKISNDVDLYVSRSKKPSEDEFQCAPLKTGTLIETCRLTSDTPGIWYIGVHGKMESNYQLRVNTDDLKLISQVKGS